MRDEEKKQITHFLLFFCILAWESGCYMTLEYNTSWYNLYLSQWLTKNWTKPPFVLALKGKTSNEPSLFDNSQSPIRSNKIDGNRESD